MSKIKIKLLRPYLHSKCTHKDLWCLFYAVYKHKTLSFPCFFNDVELNSHIRPHQKLEHEKKQRCYPYIKAIFIEYLYVFFFQTNHSTMATSLTPVQVPRSHRARPL